MRQQVIRTGLVKWQERLVAADDSPLRTSVQMTIPVAEANPAPVATGQANVDAFVFYPSCSRDHRTPTDWTGLVAVDAL